MKRLYFLCACYAINPLLATSTPPPPPPPFDADLFRKEEQVISGHLEFLYWTIEEGALDYALKMNSPAWGSAFSDTNFAQGHFKTGGYGFDPGMRLALSFFRAPRFWEVKWQYTRATFRGSDEAIAPTGTDEFLTGTWPQIISGPLTKATSHLHFNYNVFDILLSRVFHPNPHLRIRMVGGPTVAWMNQQWIVHYLNGEGDNSRLNNQWSYAAGGLKLGTSVDWFWGGDFYVTATGFGGLLMGSYHNQSKQTASTPPAEGIGSYDPSIPLKNTKLENIRGSFMAQMNLGPSWQKNFECARVEAFAGYEITIWTNLQELYRSTAAAPSASKQTWLSTSVLALHGISLRATVDF